jgi:hypothetical protein
MHGAMPIFPLYAFMSWTGTTWLSQFLSVHCFIMWLYMCETFTMQKSNGNEFWLGAFLKSGVLEDLSAINCEDGMWMKLAQNSSLKRRNHNHCIMLVFTVSIVWHCRMLGSNLHVACCVWCARHLIFCWVCKLFPFQDFTDWVTLSMGFSVWQFAAVTQSTVFCCW